METKPQYEYLTAQVNYRKFFTDGKDHWYPAIGWNSAEEARKCQPNMKFRGVDPPVKLTQKLIDGNCRSGFEGESHARNS